MSSYAFDLVKDAGGKLVEAGELIIKASKVCTLETSLRCSLVLNGLTHELKRMNDLLAYISEEDNEEAPKPFEFGGE